MPAHSLISSCAREINRVCSLADMDAVLVGHSSRWLPPASYFCSIRYHLEETLIASKCLFSPLSVPSSSSAPVPSFTTGGTPYRPLYFLLYTRPCRSLTTAIEYYTGSSWVSACLILAGSLAAVLLALHDFPCSKFIWHCFLRPLGTADQKTRLDKVCPLQSTLAPFSTTCVISSIKVKQMSMILPEVYFCGAATPCSISPQATFGPSRKSTRHRGLFGSTLVAVQVNIYIITPEDAEYLDNAAGHNIELMDKHFPVSSFDAIYLIDLCEPLLEVARARFSRKGWSNVTVLQQDASEFSLPEWANKEAKGSVSFVTLSYSLSMVLPTPLVVNRYIRAHIFRFQAFIPCSIASTMSSRQRPVFCPSSTFTRLESNPRCTKGPSAEPAKSVAGSVGGSGRSGLTLTTCRYHPTEGTTSSTSLEQ